MWLDECNLLALDTETTGLDLQNDKIWEVGAISRVSGKERAHSLIMNPIIPIPNELINISNITAELYDTIYNSPSFEFWAEIIRAMIGAADVIIGYNFLRYDAPLFDSEAYRASLPLLFGDRSRIIDVYCLVQHFFPDKRPKNLSAMAEFFGCARTAHRAVDDCYMTRDVLRALCAKLPDDLQSVQRLHAEWYTKQEADYVRYSIFFRTEDGQLFANCGAQIGAPLYSLSNGYLDWVAYKADNVPPAAKRVAQTEIERRRSRQR